MCGIAGVAGRGATVVRTLEQMAHAMVHRGPDAQGIWNDSSIGLAFRRLAIIDLDERSNQPQHLGDLHLVFNGEIYNYLELRRELSQLGHHFQTEGDGEVLLHAWSQWGEEALDRLNGMFAFAVWDANAEQLTLAVDRFAEKPLFFHQAPDRLLFGSDVRALRAADPSVGRPDPNATSRFLAVGLVPDLPATFFSDVQRLPPAHVARWSAESGLRIRRWWEPGRVPVADTAAEAAATLRGLLRESVALRLRSDVPVGTSLSGGVDSSAVAAIVSQIAYDQDRHAFTATFPGFQRDEWAFAQAAAAAAGVIRHHAVKPQLSELLDELPALVAAQEEPFGSTSIYAQWCVMRAARASGVKVMLDGQGADELFGGYLGTEGWVLRTAGPRAVASAVIKNPRDRRLLESIAFAYAGDRPPRRAARLYRVRSSSPYLDRDVARRALDYSPEPPDWTASGSPLRRQLLTQTFRSSLPQLCRFADRDSMAFGVEVRLPFLDPRIADFAFSLPHHILWREGVPKRVLRDAVHGLVPDLVLERRDKVGYETPQDKWFASDAGRRRVAEILLDRSVDHGLVRSELERDLAAGAWRDTPALWRAVNVALWHQAWH